MSLESQSFQKNIYNSLDFFHSFSEDRGEGTMFKSIDEEMAACGMDTEATSESEATACFDYTGLYRLSVICDESYMKPSHHNVICVDGLLSFHPVSGDDYVFTLEIYHSSDKVLQGSMVIAPCMDYMTSSIDQEESPYDDVLAVRDLTWVNKEKGMDVDQSNASLASLPEMEDLDRLEALVVNILSKCDMIRFVGEILVLEGPKGAIECVSHE
jgi:hypothetical protein